MSHPPRNPADLLRIGSDPSLCRLLRACGVEEACITGGASDYDKFLALAAALPLCEGHPLRDEVNTALTQATGLSAPLCPHTARTHWDRWVQLHLYGGQVTNADLPAACPCCPPVSPRVIRAEDCIRLPDPTAIQAPDLNGWSQTLESALPTDGTPALYTLPPDYTFTRPDPYHANLAVVKVTTGESLTPKERDLLVTQALRVWGLRLTENPPVAPLLLLQGGAPAAVTPLLAYLNTSGALPRTVWLPHDPAHAESVSGLYPQVGTGFTVTEGEPAEATQNKKAAYAKAAPIGASTLLTV